MSNQGYLEIIKLLIQNNANIHARDDESLRYASFSGHLEVVKFLIQNGADIHAINDDALRGASQKGNLFSFYLNCINKVI